MANIEYAHPFKSMVDGQTTALQNIENAQKARQTNLDYKFNEWYQPLKQAQGQSQVASELLKQAGAIAHYTGDYSNYNRILAHYLGIPPEQLPPGYAQGKGGANQVKAADLASGQLPIPLSYPNVFESGGTRTFAQVPGKPEDPELEGARRAALLRYYNGLGQPPPAEPEGQAVPHLDPLYGIPQENAPVTPTPTAAPGTAVPWQAPPPTIPNASGIASDATKALGTTDASSAYGIPTPKKSSPSIFEGEYDPSAFGS